MAHLGSGRICGVAHARLDIPVDPVAEMTVPMGPRS
jgi:hypothetical protein